MLFDQNQIKPKPHYSSKTKQNQTRNREGQTDPTQTLTLCSTRI